jgi:hypothetical protein
MKPEEKRKAAHGSLHRMWRRSLCPSALIFFLAAALGCSNPMQEDLAVCAGFACSAGYCISEQGRPACVCGAAEKLAGLSCVLTDGSDSQDTATELEVDGGTVEATLEMRQDHADTDWYRFEAEPDVWYAVSLESDAIPDLTAFGTDHNPFGVNPDFPRYFKTTTGGTAALEVWSGSQSTGSYRIAVQSLGKDDYGDDWQHRTPLTFGTSVEGRLEVPWDVDDFSFAQSSYSIYRVDCVQADGGGCELDFGDALHDEVLDRGRVTYLISSFESGELSFALRGNGVRGPGPYSLEVTDLGPDPTVPANEFSAPTDGGTLFTGETVPGRPFWFEYEAEADDVYWAHVSGAGCSVDPEVQPGGDAGTVAARLSSDGGGPCAVTVENVGVDDSVACPGIAPASDGSATVDIQYPGDFDPIQWTPDAGIVYRVSTDADAGFFSADWYNPSPIGRVAYIQQGTGAPLCLAVGGDLGIHAISAKTITDDVWRWLELSSGTPFDGTLDWPGDTDYFAAPAIDAGSYVIDFTSDAPNVELQYEFSAGGTLHTISPGQVTVTSPGGAPLEMYVRYASGGTDVKTPYTLRVSWP